MTFDEVINKIIIEYIKSHNAYAGKLLDITDHIVKARNILQSLPPNIRDEFLMFLCASLRSNGYIPF